jgi:hypothetical protein
MYEHKVLTYLCSCVWPGRQRDKLRCALPYLGTWAPAVSYVLLCANVPDVLHAV